MILFLCACVSIFVLVPILFFGIMGFSMFNWLKKAGELHFRSATDTFHITILEVKSKPASFTERVRVTCKGDMDLGLWVTDLKNIGIYQTNGPSGEVIYRERHPHVIGQSVPVQANGAVSTCEIVFTVSTNSTTTIWHEEVAGGTMDTTLPIPLPVTGVNTNWPNSYSRDSQIPLANLGDYKILLSVK